MENTKISLDKLNQAVNFIKEPEIFTMTYSISENKKIEIKIKKTISLTDMARFIQTVADGQFVDSIYHPEISEILYTFALLKFYTNLDLDEDNIESEMLQALIYNTDVIDRIYDKISVIQRADINDAIEKAVKFKKQQLLSTQEKLLTENYIQLQAVTNIMEQFMENFKNVNITQLTQDCNRLANIPEDKIIDKILKLHTDESENN